MLIAQRKNPDIEFTNEDLDCFCVPSLEFETFVADVGEHTDLFVDQKNDLPIRVEYDNKNNLVKMIVSFNNIDLNNISYPAEDFCNDLMDLMIRDKSLEIEDSAIVKDSMDKLSHAASQEIFKAVGRIVFDTPLLGLGFICVGEEQYIVSTIESITFKKKLVTDNASFFNEIILNDCIIASDLNAFENCNVKFYVKGRCISFPIHNMLGKNMKQGLTEYIVDTNVFTIDYAEEVSADPKNAFEDMTSFIANREQYLTEVTVKHDENDIIDDLFSFQ